MTSNPSDSSNPPDPGLESAVLVERCRGGDQDASRELFDRYVSRLISMVHRRMSGRLARRVDAEDIVQSAFRSFFVGVEKEKFQIDESGDLWRLLVVMSLNKLRRRVAYHRAGKRGMDAEQSRGHHANDENMACIEVAATEPLPDAAAAVMDEFERLTSDFAPHQLEILQLRMHGYQMEEIAEKVGRSERTVRRLLDKTRTMWQERLAELA